MAALNFVPTATADKDDLFSLGKAYRSAFGGDEKATVRAIVKRNNVPFTSKAIDDWIFSVSGKRRPFSKKDPSPSPGQGWAYFEDGNVILLPDVPRGDGKAATATRVASPAKSRGMSEAAKDAVEEAIVDVTKASMIPTPLLVMGLVGLVVLWVKERSEKISRGM